MLRDRRNDREERQAISSDRLIGDGIVPLASALGHHENPKLALTFDDSRQRVVYGTGHLDLLSRPEVYAQIKQWLAEPD